MKLYKCTDTRDGEVMAYFTHEIDAEEYQREFFDEAVEIEQVECEVIEE